MRVRALEKNVCKGVFLETINVSTDRCFRWRSVARVSQARSSTQKKTYPLKYVLFVSSAAASVFGSGGAPSFRIGVVKEERRSWSPNLPGPSRKSTNECSGKPDGPAPRGRPLPRSGGTTNPGSIIGGSLIGLCWGFSGGGLVTRGLWSASYARLTTATRLVSVTSSCQTNSRHRVKKASSRPIAVRENAPGVAKRERNLAISRVRSTRPPHRPQAHLSERVRHRVPPGGRAGRDWTGFVPNMLLESACSARPFVISKRHKA